MGAAVVNAMEEAMSDKRKTNSQDPNAYANALVRKNQVTAAEALTRGFGSAVRRVSPDEMADLAERFDLNEQIVELEAGQAIEGTLLGHGLPLTVRQKNPETGMEEERPLETWKFDIGGGLKLAIWTSYQLDRGLPPLVGKYIVVLRGPDVNVKGGKRVTKYSFGPLNGPMTTVEAVEEK